MNGGDEAILDVIRRHTADDDEIIPVTDGGGGGGFSVAVAHGSAAEALMDAMAPQLAALGCRAFWSERREPGGMKDTDEVLVLRTDDPFAAIRLRQTNGANHGVSTDDILDRLQSWAEHCQFRVVGAADAWVAIQFDTLPEKLCAFAEEVYLFCPDTVEQGVGLAREDDEPERFARARALCPNVSDRIREPAIDDFSRNLGGMDPTVAAQFKALFGAASAASTPVDMGVRLLAHDLRETRYLHLWWD